MNTQRAFILHATKKNMKEVIMIREAFKMKLKPGFEAEYKKRHNEIWPEISQVCVSLSEVFHMA